MFTTVGPDWSVLEDADDFNKYPVLVVRGRFLHPNGKPIGRTRILGVAGPDGFATLLHRLGTGYPDALAVVRFAEVTVTEVRMNGTTREHLFWLEARRQVGEPRPMDYAIRVQAVRRPGKG